MLSVEGLPDLLTVGDALVAVRGRVLAGGRVRAAHLDARVVELSYRCHLGCRARLR